MNLSTLYQKIKTKQLNYSNFQNYITNQGITMDDIQNYKNKNGENLLVYAIKFTYDIFLFEFLISNGLVLENNYYKMTPIDLCVYYNKNSIHQKFLILDWLYNFNIQFNPKYLNIYPRKYIQWLKSKNWNIEINAEDSNGNTALHKICKKYHFNTPKMNQKNNYDAFYYLLELGFCPLKKNHYNMSPIDYCFKYCLINNLTIFIHFGYNFNPNHIEYILNYNNYLSLLKILFWIIEYYPDIYTKKELENILINKINKDSKTILSLFKKKKYYDNYLNLFMFNYEENTFVS